MLSHLTSFCLKCLKSGFMPYTSDTFFTQNPNNQVKFWNRWRRRPRTRSCALLCSLCNLLKQNGFLYGGVTRANTKYLTVTTRFCRLKQVKSWDLVESLPVFSEQAVDRKGSTDDRRLSLAVNFEFPSIFYDKKLKLPSMRVWQEQKAEVFPQRPEREWLTEGTCWNAAVFCQLAHLQVFPSHS